tara:strand:+ start:776 stop:1180 length:405 start_codon:yes stop_codon:yes gene_type:complete
MTNRQDVEKLKSQGKYREAGALAFTLNPNDRDYGCHYGMRSDRSASIAEFGEGFDGARYDAAADAKSKKDFIAKVAALYRIANMSDSDNPERPRWVKPAMAGEAGCAALDTMLRAMLACGALTADEHQEFYDNV